MTDETVWHLLDLADRQRITCEHREIGPVPTPDYGDWGVVRDCLKPADACNTLYWHVGERKGVSFLYYCLEHAKRRGYVE